MLYTIVLWPKSLCWNLLIHWAISAISLVVVAYLIPGIRVDGIGPALIAPLVIGLVNATVGFIFKIVTFRSRFFHWEFFS